MDNLVRQLKLAPNKFNAYVHLPKVDDSAENHTPEQKFERTKNLLQIIDFRIKRHKRLLRSIQDNKWKTGLASKQVLFSLVSWEIESLQKTSEETQRELPILKRNLKERNSNTSH